MDALEHVLEDTIENAVMDAIEHAIKDAIEYAIEYAVENVIICLPMWETYIVFPSVYVRPPVCLSVRLFVCNAFLVQAISPRTFNAKDF